MGFLSGDELRDSLDRAHKKAWEKRINEQWEKLERQAKRLTEPEIDEKELLDNE